jgi:tetratricopeptide (TPR) repeat protein
VARGRALLTSGSEEEAEKVLSEAVALNDTDLEARFWLAQAYHVRKNLTAALSEYEKVIRMGDRSHLMEIAWSHVWSGQILDQSGKREAALLHYRTAESLHEERGAPEGGRPRSGGAWGIARLSSPPTRRRFRHSEVAARWRGPGLAVGITANRVTMVPELAENHLLNDFLLKVGGSPSCAAVSSLARKRKAAGFRRTS